MHEFEIGQRVLHKASGGVYVIVSLPEDNRLEATAEPGYGYKLVGSVGGPTWWRSQMVMEDGRFEALPSSEELKPCHSPYCECAKGKCTHPGYYDARDEPVKYGENDGS